jgi:hypothetical protein
MGGHEPGNLGVGNLPVGGRGRSHRDAGICGIAAAADSALRKNRGKKFIVEMPADVTAADRTTLLDLRAQGFDIAVRL